MREIEFLPDWCNLLRARWRAVVYQTWVAGIVLTGLVAWTLTANSRVRTAQAELNGVREQITQTGEDLRKLDDLLALEQQWRHKALVRDRLGKHVDSSRLLTEIERLMPEAMGLLELQVVTEEVPRPAKSGLIGSPAPAPKDAPTDRRVKVRLTGVSPTDVDLASFLASLTGVNVFENIAMTYARPRTESGHLMREFEVQFNVDLSGEGFQ